MKNNPKKSKALIITIIVLILLLISGYLIYKNRDVFGVKTSATIAKIFSPLIPSNNSTDLTSINQNSNDTGQNIFGQPGSCSNGADNPPICTTANGVCKGGENNPPACTTISGIGPTGNICENGAVNPDACTLNSDGTCKNGANNPDVCTLYSDQNPGLPDLVAGSVTPINAIINKPTTLSSTITNIGSGSTGSSFTSFFTITTVSIGKSATANVIIPSLDVSVGNVATISHTFNATGNYSIRVCADKSSSSNAGTIPESNENNNCGPWTTLTVTNSLPPPGDTCPNGATNPPTCTTFTPCANGATNPPICTTFTPCANGATNPPTCTPPIIANKCLAIEQNPLTFTDEEKARLAILLRKFYLISSTLKTKEDITTIYNEIDQQKNFINQIEDLTKQCYLQTNDQLGYSGFCSKNSGVCNSINDKFTTGYTSLGTTKHGNPWYTKTSGRSFPYTSEDSGYLNPASLDDANTERILNIW